MEEKLNNSFINSSMLQRDIDALWPGCSLHFNRRLLNDITGLPFQHMEYK